MTLGVDYSLGRPNLDELWSAGIRFVCRYLAYRPNPKVLTGPELKALHDKGFGVVLNWEQAEGDMLKGYTKGRQHATEALKLATALGCPPQVPIYFSCDVNTSASERVIVGQYLDGCVSVLGLNRVGVYGEFDVIEQMVPSRAHWGWQTYAWSGARVSGRAHFLQYRNGVTIAGADCDLNTARQSNIGAWFKESVDMAISDADVQRIADAVWTRVLGQGVGGYAAEQACTSLAFTWQRAAEASESSQEAARILGELAPIFHGLSGVGGLTADDRDAVQRLTDAVTALSNRLATP